MGLDVFFEVLRTLKGLATEITFVRFQGYMDSDMGGDVVTLDSRCTTTAPLTGQVEVVGALTANMTLADVFLSCHIRMMEAW